MRKTYLQLMDAAEANRLVLSRVRWGERNETIETADAFGRVSARAVTAHVSSPAYHGAAMDGFAVKCRETVGASAKNPVRLTSGAQAKSIDTGEAMPDGFDAVVMIEDVHFPDDDSIEIVSSLPPYKHVRLTGEDVVAGELVLPQGKRVSAYDIGALLAAGRTQITVRRRPTVALIATGNELIEPGESAAPGDVVEFNTKMLAALISDWGGAPRHCPPVKDDPATIRAAVQSALAECDIVVVNAGSSAGTEDFTPQVLSEVGDLLVHGINVMPGKPTAAAVTGAGQPIIGLPGYPVSAAVAAERMLRPLVASFLGVLPKERETLRAFLARKVPSKIGHEEVLRVQVGRVGERWIAAPLRRGAGVITSLSRANGLLVIPPLAEGFDAHQEVQIELLVPGKEAELTLVHVGSHDLALDLAGDLLRKRHPGRALASANAGSLGGLYALSRGECHIAGTHLIDPETGIYNVPYVARVCKNLSVTLIQLVEREQGWTVARGNPKSITCIEDLVRDDVVFVNRQRGAGTRVLLDTRLADANINANAVAGYDREEHSHMAAAVAVASGIADCALTIRAAAEALDLDFVPLETESFQLAVLTEELEADHIVALLDTIRSPDFKKTAEALGGYSAKNAGALVAKHSPD